MEDSEDLVEQIGTATLLLKAVFKNTQETLLVINEMREVAAAFAKVGNSYMSDKFHEWADKLQELADELRVSHSQNLEQTVKVAQQASDTMVKSALGTVKKG
jgi:hypothetical protein